MPGSSLWLVPPPSSPLSHILRELITSTLPSHLPAETGAVTSPSTPTTLSPHFFPAHITLTSGILPETYGDEDPQAWLDSIPWPATTSGSGLKVRFTGIESQDVFYRRCFIRVELNEGVRKLAGLARARGVIAPQVGGDGDEGEVGKRVEEWLAQWEKAFGPHVSLMYGNVPLSKEKLAEIAEVVEKGGIKLDASSADAASEGKFSGWEGGVVWLVPTDKPISEWKPIATKAL